MHPLISNKIVIFTNEENIDQKLDLIQNMIDEDKFIWYVNHNHFCDELEGLMNSWANSPVVIDNMWSFVVFSESTYFILRELLIRNLEDRRREVGNDEEEMENYYVIYPQQIGYCYCGQHFTGVPGIELEGAEGGLLD